jgi:flagellar basal body-associated protein FliL
MKKRVIKSFIGAAVVVAIAAVATWGALAWIHHAQEQQGKTQEASDESKTPPTITEIREQTQTVTDQPSKDETVQVIEKAQEQAVESKDAELQAQLQAEDDFAKNTPVDPGSTQTTYDPPKPQVK